MSVRPVAQRQSTERKQSDQAVMEKAVTHSGGKQSDELQLVKNLCVNH